MDLRIAQDFEYKGDDWWTWSIWLDGSEEALDQVESVTYKLHPTFPRPVRKVTDRGSRFRLKNAGWGVFLIHAKVVTKQGAIKQLEHQLELQYPDGSQTSA